MDENGRLEYQVLSEDRRQGIAFFLKGFVIAVGIIAFGFKFLLESQDRSFALALGLSGMVTAVIGLWSWAKCRAHVRHLTTRLRSLGKEAGIAPAIGTDYIFTTALAVSVLLALCWIGATVYVFLTLQWQGPV